MRQDSSDKKTGASPKPRIARRLRKRSKTKVQASRLVAKKAPKREGSESREPEKRLAEALQRQAATDEILRVMSSSPGNVHPVLNAVAERAAGLCDAAFAQVLLVEGDVLRPTAAYWADVGLDKSPGPKRTWPLTRGLLIARAALDCETIHHDDVVPLLDSEYLVSPRAKQQELGYRAVLVVPLIREGGASGVIFMFRREPRPFSPEQIALVETFARQAAIAIENARLFNETKEALERQTATSEILRVISQSPTDVQPVFDTIMRSAVRLSDGLFGTVSMFDGEMVHRPVAYHNYTPDALAAVHRTYPMRPSVQQLTGRAILGRAVAHLPDVLSDPDYAPDIALAGGWRGGLAVPMLRDGHPIGVILVTRAQAGPFSDQQIALLKTFADQAVIAIENVRLFKELEQRNSALAESLEQQTATSEVLRVIARSPTDTQPMFDMLAQRAGNLCDAEVAVVSRFDGGLIELAAIEGVDPEGVNIVRSLFPMQLSAQTVTARAIRNATVVQIADVLADQHYEMKDFARAAQYRAGLGVPILRDQQVIGSIFVGRSTPGLFADSQVELLKTFADQAVIAIENVRLFTELEARTAQLTRSVGELKALGEIGQAVSSTLDLETVLRTIVSRATKLSGMDAGSIYEYDEVRAEFYLHTTDNLPDEVAQALRAKPTRKGEGALGRMAVTAEPVQIRDIVSDRSYQSRVRELLIRLGYRSLLAVPLLREDHLLGGLVVNRKSTGEFAPEVIELLQTFASQSALAIQNARLFREIEVKSRELETASRHKSEFLANMSHELRTPLNAIIGFSEVLAERLFGEINDKQAEYLRDILESGQHLLSLINDILDLSKIEAGRMELELSEFQLPHAIENTLTLVRERASRHGIKLGRTLDEHLGTVRADERKVKQVLLNLLSNALKFTPEGGRIDVTARKYDGMAEISVTDTGVGIAPDDQGAVFEEFRQVGAAARKVEGTGLGLAISRKFIELHGGRIWVSSEVGSGSAFTFTLPLQ